MLNAPVPAVQRCGGCGAALSADVFVFVIRSAYGEAAACEDCIRATLTRIRRARSETDAILFGMLGATVRRFGEVAS